MWALTHVRLRAAGCDAGPGAGAGVGPDLRAGRHRGLAGAQHVRLPVPHICIRPRAGRSPPSFLFHRNARTRTRHRHERMRELQDKMLCIRVLTIS